MKYLSISTLVLASATIGSAADSESVLDQLTQDLYNPDVFLSGTLSDEALFAPTSDGDSDLGEQLILRRTPKSSPIHFNWDNNIFHSNNVANVDVGTQSGFMFNSKISADWTYRAKDNLFINVSAAQSIFEYENNFDLDFSNSKTSVGVVSFLHPYDVALSAKLIHNFASENLFSDKIHGITSLQLGASKTFYHSSQELSYASLNLEADLDTSSTVTERNEISLRFGHVKKFTDELSVTLYGDISHFDYDQAGRVDTTMAFGAAVEYAITGNITAQSSLTYITNNSNQTGLDYSSTLGALGISLNAKF